MNHNLTDDEMAAASMAAGQPVTVERITEVRRIVRHALEDQLATPSEAEMQAGLYRELLNYPQFPELRQHVMTRLTQLQAGDRTVN